MHKKTIEKYFLKEKKNIDNNLVDINDLGFIE